MVMIPVRLLLLCLLSQGWQCTQTKRPQNLALTCFPPKWSSLVCTGAAGLPCTSPLASAFFWVGLCPFGEGYIHWLVPAEAALLVTWSVAVTRRHPAGASVPAVWPAEWSPESSSVQSVWAEPEAAGDRRKLHKAGSIRSPLQFISGNFEIVVALSVIKEWLLRTWLAKKCPQIFTTTSFFSSGVWSRGTMTSALVRLCSSFTWGQKDSSEASNYSSTPHFQRKSIKL